MNRVLTTALALCLATAGLTAQHKPGGPGKKHGMHQGKSPEKRAEKVTEWMTAEAGLSPDQATKVKQANLTAFLKMHSLKADTTLAAEQKKMQLKAIKAERKNSLKAILTPEQQEKLKASVKAKNEARKAGKAGNGKKPHAPKGPNLNDEELDDLLD